MKTTLKIPDPLFRKARAAAARDGKPIKSGHLLAIVSRQVYFENEEGGPWPAR